MPTRVSFSQVLLAGSTFESKKWGCLEKQSCQPHFLQTAVTQAVTSLDCVSTHSGAERNRWASSLSSVRHCGLQNNKHIVRGRRSENSAAGWVKRSHKEQRLRFLPQEHILKALIQSENWNFSPGELTHLGEQSFLSAHMMIYQFIQLWRPAPLVVWL